MSRLELRRPAWAVVALIAAFGVMGQVTLSLTGTSATDGLVAESVSVFSYWTVQTNTLVALACGVPLLAPTRALARFFMRPIVRMALVIYIATTGIIYAVLLAGLWSPTGFQRFVDVILHYVTPALYPLSWLLLDDHGQLKWADLPKLLIYPLTYLAYSLGRGALIGSYPYPFIDVNALGYAQVFINSAALALVFLILGAALFVFDHAIARRRQLSPAGSRGAHL